MNASPAPAAAAPAPAADRAGPDDAPDLAPDARAALERFHADIEPDSLRALWSVMGSIITPEPTSPCEPHLWRWDTVRTRLLEAAPLISAKQAERRVLIMENPGLAGTSKVTTSLYAGVQLVMPGEVAPSHRHAQSALRLVLEAPTGGGGAGRTSVGGERATMRPGDFLITPSWEWHDHANDSDEPVLWLDGLDIPLVQFLDASFAEGLGEDVQPLTRPDGDSLARYGANMLPLGYAKPTPTSPIFAYPYERSREALELLRRDAAWDACHGLKMRYVNPVDGGWAMPTIGTCLQLLPAGFETEPYRSTDATVFSVVEGRGVSTIEGRRFEWGPRDAFVVPSWRTVVHAPDGDAVLFSYSDRPVHEKLGLFRERRGPGGRSPGGRDAA